MEVLFKGPLNEATETIQCNYVIYWSRDYGMDLVDKWTTEGKITDDNKNQLNTYWKNLRSTYTPNQPINCSSGTQATIPRYFEFRRLSH